MRSRTTILEQRAGLDVRLRTTLIYQPGWLRARDADAAQPAAAAGARLWRSASGDDASAPPMRRRSSLGSKETRNGTGAFAVGGTVRGSLFLGLRVSLEQDLAQHHLGRPTPSFGLQLEQSFD